jgi:hypothetical protein
MKKARDVYVLVTVAAAFSISLWLFRSAVGLTSPWFGLMIMLAFLGVIAFARPLFILRLPVFWRTARDWEMDGRLYQTLRVPAFGGLLRQTPLRFLNPMVYLKQNPSPSIVQAQIDSAEATHLLAAALLLPYIVCSGIRGRWAAVAWLLIIQIGGNLYPILHLRWARVRINRLQRRTPSSRTIAAWPQAHT